MFCFARDYSERLSRAGSLQRLKSFFISIFLGENVEEIFNRDLFYSCSEMKLFRRLRRGQTESGGIAVDTSARSFP